MKFQFSILIALVTFVSMSCNNTTTKVEADPHQKINQLFENYWQERMKLYPLEATQSGDNRYNDLFPNDISESYRAKLQSFYKNFTDSLNQYDRSSLNNNDAMSYDILKWELNENLDAFRFPTHLMPINQFWSNTLTMAQLGSGTGNQPFKTVKDYENFLGRINGFTEWCDTAISNMHRGIEQKIVLPKILAERVVPQLKQMLTDKIETNVFYTPVSMLDTLKLSNEDKQRLKDLYTKAITEQIIPAYKRLYDFWLKDYLPACRNSTGISDIPFGKDYYAYLIKFWTTTDMKPDEIFSLGESEVKRIHAEIEKVKDEVGFKGDLKAFFKYINSDKKFFPYKTPAEVINGYHEILTREEPQLKKLFNLVPKSKFEIRQTEKFREASASAEYQQGTPDGVRPGIFYVPVPDATKANLVGMESLFLHEAIPGHHYQLSLQQENDSLPKFRRFIWYGAYGEGWALYTESLGKDLGLYTDPYQYLGCLSGEMHRAIRLVVDVGMHYKGWTREQAIQFSLDNETDSEESITAEIERYMAIPGQALAYKIGQLKILALRKEAQDKMGDKFSMAAFHDVMLMNGCLPIKTLEEEVNRWIEKK